MKNQHLKMFAYSTSTLICLLSTAAFGDEAFGVIEVSCAPEINTLHVRTYTTWNICADGACQAALAKKGIYEHNSAIKKKAFPIKCELGFGQHAAIELDGDKSVLITVNGSTVMDDVDFDANVVDTAVDIVAFDTGRNVVVDANVCAMNDRSAIGAPSFIECQHREYSGGNLVRHVIEDFKKDKVEDSADHPK